MSDEDTKPVTITIPKRRTYSHKLFMLSSNKKQLQEKQIHTRKFNDELQKYALPDEVLLPLSKLKQSEIIIPFKQYCKQQDRSRFKRRLNISIKDKYKVKAAGLQNRLHVDSPVNDIYSVIDVDADYYRFLGPLQIQYPCYKSLKESMNQILKLKLEIGIKKDCILNKEINYRNELDIYTLSVKHLTDQAKYFDSFISEDYKMSMNFLSKWDKVKHQRDDKVMELQNLGIEKFTLKSRLIGLDYKYSVQLKYGRFLYYLSPPIWRLNNREFARSVEIEAKGFDYGNSHDEGTFAIIFEKLCKICFGTPIKPAIYFTEPKDLIDIFKGMENQQLYYYAHVNHLTPLTKILKHEIKSLKEVISQDYALVANLIKKYEFQLKFSEEKCAQLEQQFYKILFGTFFDSIAATDVLKLFSHLEFCYERVFLEKPTNLDITFVARSIENLYMNLSKRLDAIQSKTVRDAMVKCEETERLKVKKAKYAAKELRLFNRLENELLKAYSIYTDNLYIPIKGNSVKNTVKQNNSSHIPKAELQESKSLTEAEKEYLLLFTDWTANEDPANYLQSLTFN